MRVGSVVLIDTSMRDREGNRLLGIVESMESRHVVLRYCYSDINYLHNEMGPRHRTYLLETLQVVKE